MRRTRKKSLIMAVARPAYPETVTVELDQLSKGSKGDNVKALQMLLIGRGFGCGSAGADGSFGQATEAAVLKYKQAKGLTGGATVGATTWKFLLGQK